jgi:hypothetical protein
MHSLLHLATRRGSLTICWGRCKRTPFVGFLLLAVGGEEEGEEEEEEAVL